MQNLTVLAFPNPTQAFEVRKALVKLENESLLELIDAVVVTRDGAGKVELHQSEDGTAAFAAAGSVSGMIVGAIFMNPWFGSVVGTASGAVIGALVDLGINDQFIKELGATVTPGTSALFLLGSKMQLDQAGAGLAPLLQGCTMLQTSVTQDRADEIRRVLGVA